MSDITFVDIGLETDTAVIGIDRYSDFSEPGSPTAAASLDRAAAMASATLSSSSAAAEGTSADIRKLPPSLDLAGFIDSFNRTSGTNHTITSEGCSQSCGVGSSVLGAVISPDGTSHRIQTQLCTQPQVSQFWVRRFQPV